MRLLVIVGLACGALGCKDGDVARTCGALVERVTECAGPEEPPRGAMENMHRYCEVSLQYEREPDDAPGNMAELAKRALQECAALRDCDELTACLDRNRCQFVLTDPADTSLEFSCTPPPP